MLQQVSAHHQHQLRQHHGLPDEPDLVPPERTTTSNAEAEELGVEYSVRRPSVSSEAPANGTPLGPAGDLLPAAQHSYGAHYGSLHGHHGGGHFYQFASSHKKGQFDSGFKRGNKKFHISGHSSQHKGHAEGHVKWKAKKGKGTHYWDLKHKDKKHHYAGHHHYR